jgi:hypothetical protein
MDMGGTEKDLLERYVDEVVCGRVGFVYVVAPGYA